MDLSNIPDSAFTLETNFTDTPEAAPAEASNEVKPERTIKPIPDKRAVSVEKVDEHGTRDAGGKFKSPGAPDATVGPEDDDEEDIDVPLKAEGAEEPRKESKAEKRIRKLVEERNDAERLLAAERRDRERLLAERQPQPTVPQADGADYDPTEPREEDFPDHKSYVRALAKHEATRLVSQDRMQQQAERYAAHAYQRIESFREKVKGAGGDKFLATLPESIKNLKPTDSLGEGEKPGPLNFLANEIVYGERGMEILQHLTANPSALRSFSTARDPYEFNRVMGRIEVALDAATTGQPAQETSKPKAPPFEPKGSPPLTPVTGGSHVAESDADLDEQASAGTISPEEYMRRANARDRARRKHA